MFFYSAEIQYCISDGLKSSRGNIRCQSAVIAIVIIQIIIPELDNFFLKMHITRLKRSKGPYGRFFQK